jgi:hypothetical protein
MSKKIKLQLFPNRFTICKFRSNYTHPKWAENDIFYSITKTEEELSVITLENSVQMCADRSDGWRLIKVMGPLDFSLIGIIYSLTELLAMAKISVFTISTYDTDYLLVREDRVEDAVETLKKKFLFVEYN